MAPAALILGLSGPVLSANERAFFRDANPWAFILFKRNVETPDQVRRLCADLRDAVGRDALIFVDQEGGRVQRLRAPHWPAYPAGAIYAALYEQDPKTALRAAYLGHRLIADDLRAVGITANCAPVLDLPQPDADPIISDRAFGTSVDQIVALAHASLSGLMSGGVAPVIKHIPGHGRATVDSHKALPIITTDFPILDETDFAIFHRLSCSPMAMTAHAVYTAVENKVATHSRRTVLEVIRSRIGFQGLLLSDDLDMKALPGENLTKKTTATYAAGCDIALQCSGKFTDMVAVAKGAVPLSGAAQERATIAELCAGTAEPFARGRAEAEFDAFLSQAVV
jgi:beta-N-acetylhexosaminidase